LAARGIHHLGLAVDDLEAGVATYEALFALGSSTAPPARASSARPLLVGTDRIELLASEDDDSAIGKFLARRGPGLHHVAYAVEDIRAELAAARGGRRRGWSPPSRSSGSSAIRSRFVQPDSVHGVLTEYVEHG